MPLMKKTKGNTIHALAEHGAEDFRQMFVIVDKLSKSH